MDKKIIDIQEEVKEDNKLVKLLKRTYIVIIALILVLLLLMNTNTGYHLISFFSGKIVSSNLNQDFTFDLKFGGKVVFNETVWINLGYIYDTNRKYEFKVCLTGHKQDNSYYVTGLYMPKIYGQTVYSVQSQVCNNETVISLHSHPPLRCIFSEQDINSYNQFNRINPDAMIGLMCGETRLSFFGYG